MNASAYPRHPFAFAAADITYIVAERASGNCRVDNDFSTLFSLLFVLRPCP